MQRNTLRIEDEFLLIRLSEITKGIPKILAVATMIGSAGSP